MDRGTTQALGPEAELASRIAAAAPARDSAAEAALYRLLAPRVRLYGRRHLRDDEAADDLMQEVMMMTLEKLRAGELREPERIASFVFGACRMVTMEIAAARGGANPCWRNTAPTSRSPTSPWRPGSTRRGSRPASSTWPFASAPSWSRPSTKSSRPNAWARCSGFPPETFA
jgi:hypothetical protein